VGVRTEVFAQLGVVERQVRAQVEVVGGLPAALDLGAVDLGRAGVADLGEAVRAEHGELEVVPVLVEHRAVEREAMVEPQRLPAELVVRQEVGEVRRTEAAPVDAARAETLGAGDRKSTRLNSSHLGISYAVFCLKKKNK